MVKNLYVIRDLKADYCMDVQTYRNDGEATRMFELAAHTAESFISQFPSHFELLHIATVNDLTGEVEAVHPRIVCSGNDFIGKDLDA